MKSRGILKIFIFLFLQGKQIMQNTNKRTDTRRTLGELCDYEDRANLLSPKNSEKFHYPNLDSENFGEKGFNSNYLIYIKIFTLF